MLLGDEVGFRADGSEHRASGWAAGRVAARRLRASSRGPIDGSEYPTRDAARAGVAAAGEVAVRRRRSSPSSFRDSVTRMRAPTSAPSASPPPPILLVALAAGIVLRVDGSQLIAFVLTPWVLPGVFVLNLVVLIYRLVAIVDAYRVTAASTPLAATGGGRLGRPRLVFNPLSVAGLAGGRPRDVRRPRRRRPLRPAGPRRPRHPCVFVQRPDRDCDCDTRRVAGRRPATGRPSRHDRPTADARPASRPSGLRRLPERVDPAVERQGAAEHPADRLGPAAGRRHLQHRHADRRLDRPVDQAGRDVQPAARLVDMPAAAGPGSRTPTARVYPNKINSLFTDVRDRGDLVPGDQARRAATTPSRRSSATSTGSTSSTSSRSTSTASSRSSTRWAG